MSLRSHLVDDWRSMSRWWSVRMAALGGVLSSVLILVPAMPAEIQALLPPAVRVILVALWAVASIYARVVKQKQPSGGGK